MKNTHPYYRNILRSFIDMKKLSRAPIRKWLAAEAQVIPIRYGHLQFFLFSSHFPMGLRMSKQSVYSLARYIWFQIEQGKKVCTTTAFRSYQCFSLLSLPLLLAKPNDFENNKKSSALLSTASA